MSNVNNAIIQHEKLVFEVVRKQFPSKSEDEDIIQIGRIGLWKAIESEPKFKPKNFRSYAKKCIRNEIIHELERQNAQKRTPSEGEFFLDAYQDISSSTFTHENYDIVGSEDMGFKLIQIKDYISKLLPQNKKIYEMTKAGSKPSEIADVLNISVRTVRAEIRQMKSDIIKLCY